MKNCFVGGITCYANLYERKERNVDYYREEERDLSNIISCSILRTLPGYSLNFAYFCTLVDVKYIESIFTFGTKYLNCLDVQIYLSRPYLLRFALSYDLP